MSTFDAKSEITKLAKASYNQGRIDSLETFKDGIAAVLEQVNLSDDQKEGIKLAVSCADLSLANYKAEKNQ